MSYYLYSVGYISWQSTWWVSGVVNQGGRKGIRVDGFGRLHKLIRFESMQILACLGNEKGLLGCVKLVYCFVNHLKLN